jgi:ABC-type oligopeptide transport system substrate-binding subunit
MSDKYWDKATEIVENWSLDEGPDHYINVIANSLGNAAEAGYKAGAKDMLNERPRILWPEEPTNPSSLSAEYRQGWLNAMEMIKSLNSNS